MARRTPTPLPTQAVCPVCEQQVPLDTVTRSTGTPDEFAGRFAAHDRVVTPGKPPRRCPSSAYVSHPERYDTDDD